MNRTYVDKERVSTEEKERKRIFLLHYESKYFFETRLTMKNGFIHTQIDYSSVGGSVCHHSIDFKMRKRREIRNEPRRQSKDK